MDYGDFFHPSAPAGDGSFTWYPPTTSPNCRRFGVPPSADEVEEYRAAD